MDKVPGVIESGRNRRFTGAHGFAGAAQPIR
jgi:hypothetical protein